MSTRHWVTVAAAGSIAIAAIAGGRAAGALHLSKEATPDQADPQAALVREGLGTRVATFGAADGAGQRNEPVDRAVYVAKLSSGSLCVIDADMAGKDPGGGCNPTADPLGGRSIWVSFMFDGGPGVASVTDARLSGLVDGSVAQLRALMSDGSQRNIPLTKDDVAGTSFRAFAFRIAQTDLLGGVTPIAVVAFDDSGSQLDRQATGLPTTR